MNMADSSDVNLSGELNKFQKKWNNSHNSKGYFIYVLRDNKHFNIIVQNFKQNDDEYILREADER